MQLVPLGIHLRTAHTGSIGIGNLPGRKMEWKSMMPVLTNSFPPTSMSALEVFEQTRQVRLPATYKALLLQANGGTPEPSAFPIDGMELNPTGAVQVFFGLNTGGFEYDLAEMLDWFQPTIPAGIIPIACTGGADFICLDSRGGSDRVVFWDNRHHWGTGEWREEDLYHVANTFEEFIASLKPNVFPDNDP